MLPVGSSLSLPLPNADLKIVDSFTLLGMEIRRSLDKVNELFLKAGEKQMIGWGKTNDLILFWSRFRLSLKGRISIMKNFVFWNSQSHI